MQWACIDIGIYQLICSLHYFIRDKIKETVLGVNAIKTDSPALSLNAWKTSLHSALPYEMMYFIWSKLYCSPTIKMWMALQTAGCYVVLGPSPLHPSADLSRCASFFFLLCFPSHISHKGADSGSHVLCRCPSAIAASKPACGWPRAGWLTP